MFWTAASRCAPRVSAEGSLKFPGSFVVEDAAGAGDGVAGASDVVVVDVWAGAAGAAGVCAADGAGVEGAFAADEEPPGAALGFPAVRAALRTLK